MEYSSIAINRKRTTHSTLSLEIDNESHTLGNLVKERLLQEHTGTHITFAGYRKHHPLVNQIELKVQVKDLGVEDSSAASHAAIPIIQQTNEKIVKDIDVLLNQLN